MEICILTSKFGESEYYSPRYRELSASYLAKGHTVHIVDLMRKGQLSYERLGNLHIHRMKGLGIPLLANRILLGVLARKTLRQIEDKVDIFDAHDIHAFLLRHIIKKPFVVFMPTPNIELFKSVSFAEGGFLGLGDNAIFIIFVAVVSFVQYLALKGAAAIITTCRHYRDFIVCRWHINEEKVMVIPAGVNIKKFTLENQDNIYASLLNIQGEKVILTMARLSQHKGIQYLIKAFKEISLEFPDVILVIAGDGRYRRHLEALTNKLGCRGRVRFAGWVDYEKQAQSIYALCDIFVLPSPVEGTPLVLLEAMASGKPVIATDTGGVSGIIDDGRNGFIIEPKDILGLKERILLLLNSGDLRRRIGEAARAKMVERFSWDKIADDMLKIYSDLAGR